MYEYKFVRVDGKGFFDRKPREDYRQIIEEHSRDGWRFVQVFKPTILVIWAIPMYYELIFEKEIE